MSVIALYKYKGKIRMTGDGRATELDRIITDHAPKVYSSPDNSVIYGIVGECADIMLLSDAIEMYAHSPLRLLRYLNSEEMLKHLLCCAALYVTDNGRAFLIDSVDTRKGGNKQFLMTMSPITQRELPHFIGSGATVLRAIFKTLPTYSKANVEKAYKLAYQVDASIGGTITHKELEITN